MFRSATIIVSILSFTLISCGSSDDSGGSGAGGIPSISASCGSATGGTCTTGGNGDGASVAWAISSCASFDVNSVVAYADGTATCSGSGCSFSASTGWKDMDTDEPANSIGSAYTAVAWLNFVDNSGGAGEEGPATGDIFCCKDNQTSSATLGDDDCEVVP